MENLSTIAAIATPQGTGGIGIIRISGPEAVTLSASVFRRGCKKHDNITQDKRTLNGKNLSLPYQSHKLYHGYIFDPETNRDIDEVLFVIMKKPNSYTREDVVEIQAHSGPFVLRVILEILIQKGVQLAGPGEFTKRAFLNGRLDLTQAEAVMDIINAKSAESMKIAASQIKGQLGNQISNFRKILLDLLTKIEAGIDFPDEAGDIIDYKVTAEIINNDIILPLKNLVLHYDNAHFLRDGIKLAIIGAPNVGKSSLMNQLIEQERSIVTSIPGTTRDFVEDCLNLNGVPFVITDTAGIHDSSDPVEIIGIQKTLEKIEEANIILLVKDISTPHKLENSVLKKSIIDNCKEKKIITVYNKIDIINPSDNGKSKNNKSSNSRTKDGNTKDSEIGIKLNYLTKDKYAVAISALSGQGILNLKKKIVSICLGDNGLDNLKDAQSSILPNLRHKILIEQAISAADTAYQGFNCELSLELIAIDISESLQLLNDVSGISSQPDILDSIFKNFCIGK